MKPTDRARLTAALREQVARFASDLRAQMRSPGEAREAARKVHADERVAEDFEVWTDLLSRRAAVLWVLKSVYVRVLEDRGLLRPGRLLDPEAQQLFERIAPHLGETAFLRWVYRDLAKRQGGLPELFSPQPAEVAEPSNDLSRALLAFWRHRDADSGATWSFAEEHFEGELMGDLYQELDPVVKDRFALCQTPDFVRGFILDRTLTPALETFGADQVRLLDPACGSGHFLIDGLKRLVAATAALQRDWPREKVVLHALDRVVGLDLNDYACGLARARLVMTAAELAGGSTLAEAARFHPHVYWADGLEQIERGEATPNLQFSLFEKIDEKPRATLTRSDVRVALRTVFATNFHAVVVNPPYIIEEDEKRKAYQRELIGKARRYVSAYGDYSLGAPFAERAFQLAVPDGFVGIITANNFMARDFGRPLVRDVLSKQDLSLIVDTSGAILANSGFETPTIMFFGRRRRPTRKTLRVVRGKAGDTERIGDHSLGPVWSSIVTGWGAEGFENAYVSVTESERSEFAEHPWFLRGGGAGALKALLDRRADVRLRHVRDDIGRTTVCGHDSVFMMSLDTARRIGASDFVKPLAVGEVVRDWVVQPTEFLIYPYDEMGGEVVAGLPPRLEQYFWRFRTLLRSRTVFGKSPEDRGGRWYQHLEHYAQRLRDARSITFAFITTHNQFAFDDGGKLFNRSAPVVKIRDVDGAPSLFHLLGVLNSSALGFWFKQTFHRVGGRSSGTKRQSEPWAQRHEYAVGLLENAPIPLKHQRRVATLAEMLSMLAREYTANLPTSVFATAWTPATLVVALAHADHERDRIRLKMVALQEELDWTIYAAFGLASADELPPLEEVEPLASSHRPFAIRLARRTAQGTTSLWFQAMHVEPCIEVPSAYASNTRERLERRLRLTATNEELALLESPESKRKWEPFDSEVETRAAALTWLADRIELVISGRGRPKSLSQVVGAVQGDAPFLSAAGVYQGRRDVDIAGVVVDILAAEAIPQCPYHVYTDSGLAKRAAWEEVWALQRREDAGEKVGEIPVPPEYSQGSRGKATDFLRTEYWQIRGKLDVPKERFIAFTEVPGRSGAETLYGWAGWTPLQRLKAILGMDEELEDAGVPLADRTGLLDSAWRLLPDVAREDAAAATRLKAELQAVVGPEGPSRELVEDWRRRFPPPTTRAARVKKAAAARDDDEREGEAGP